MIYDYEEVIKACKGYTRFINALNKKKIFKIAKGIYSNEKNPNPFEIFVKKHKNVVFTMESALFYSGVSDYIPTKYYIATDKDATKYKDNNIKQYFDNSKLLGLGVIEHKHLGVKIKMYNKERMLLELIRYKNKMPFDYYREVIKYYRDNIEEINIRLIQDYLEQFPKKEFIQRILTAEVF